MSLNFVHRTNETKGTTGNNGRELSENFLYNSYKTLSVLEKNFYSVYGLISLGAEGALVFVIVSNIFMAIVLEDIPGLVRALAMSFLTRGFYSKLAEVHSMSSAAVDSWKFGMITGNGIGNGRSLWFNKFVRSVRPLRVHVGSFFYVDKYLLLTIMSIILEQTANLILSYK